MGKNGKGPNVGELKSSKQQMVNTALGPFPFRVRKRGRATFITTTPGWLRFLRRLGKPVDRFEALGKNDKPRRVINEVIGD